MARKIIRLPGRMSFLILRLIGAAITFLFGFFVYASGQVIQANRGLAKADSSVVPPEYGPAPLYGVVLYGMPYASFTIKGTVISAGPVYGKSAISSERLTLQDTLTKQIVDSAVSKEDGSFSMTFSEMPRALMTWILITSDGGAPGCCATLDTLISVPQDSLKGGSGFYAGADTVNIDPLAGCGCLLSKDPVTNDNPQTLAMKVWQVSGGAIEARYMLPNSERIHMALYGISGKLMKEFIDRSESAGVHDTRLETSGLPAGIYFLKLQTGSHAAITRISIDR